MPISFIYWLCMFLWLVFGLGWNYYTDRNLGALPGGILLFIMMLLIGLQLFGSPVK